MKRKDIWQAVELELRRQKKKHPNFPDHVAAQAGIANAAAGNLMEVCLMYKYENDLYEAQDHVSMMKQEALKTAAAAIRFLEHLKTEQ